MLLQVAMLIIALTTFGLIGLYLVTRMMLAVKALVPVIP